MRMKFKRLVASMLAAALLFALLPAPRPRAAASNLSEWVLASQAPSWAKIVERKYTYTLTTTTESRETSLAGYSQTGSYWVKSGNGAAHYASFPGGFDPSNAYYTGFLRSAYSAYENTTSRRDVSNSWAGYIYWHWMYDTSYANGTSQRAIYNQKGTGPANGYAYKYFGAFTSTSTYTDGGTGYCNNLGIRNYIVSDRKSWDLCQGSTRWFRFDYYTSSYTDYYKMFQYRKVEEKESATMPSGTGVSNVQEWVRYLLQSNVSFDVNYDSVPVNHMRAPTVEAGWTLNGNGTLHFSADGITVTYDPTDESFTFDTAGQTIEKNNIDLYRVTLDETLPEGKYLNLSVRNLSGSQTLNSACLVLEGAPLDSHSISSERCYMDIKPKSDGSWSTVSAGPLTANQSANVKSIVIWLYNSANAKFDQLKLQFSVSFSDQPMSAHEICNTPVEKSVFCNDAYGTLPQPERTGYSFAGWYTQRNGGDLITEETVMSRNEAHTLYAAWTANSYALHLDKQDGTEPISVNVTFDKAIGELPVPQREGYHFFGWYTEPAGGTLVESTEIVNSTQERTVYACWIPNELLSCGDGLSWDLKGNRLTISGSGAVKDYAAGESPFSRLSGYIRELVIEKGVNAIGDNALANVSQITALVLPETVELLGQGALSNCSALTTVRVENPRCQLCEMPDSLAEVVGYSGSTAEAYAAEHACAFRSLGFYAEKGEYSVCYRDENNTLYINGTGALPDYAVGEAPWYAKRLTMQAVEITGNITYIGNNSFAGCEQLSAISLPKTAKSFGENVFEDTPWYTSKPKGVVILNGVIYGFRGSEGENNVVLSGGITKIESNFSLTARQGEDSLKSLQISSSVTQIEDGALSWFSALSELTLQKGNAAYQVVNHVLYSKDMRQLVCYPAGLDGKYRLPASVAKIRPYAFAGCKNLTELHLGAEVKSIGVDAFAGTRLQTIYGYYGSYAHRYAEKNGYDFVPYTTTVTLDSNNDFGEISTLEVNTGCAIGALPVPEQDGYRFLGWFLETEREDLQITAEYVVTEEITLLAFWEELPQAGPYLKSLSILTLPNKLDYFCGESLITDGLSLSAHFSDGTVTKVTEGFSCVPSRMNTPGSQLVTVYYAGLSATFTVQVTEVIPISLVLVSLPKVLTYYVTTGEEEESPLNTQGLVGLVEFNNGTQRLVNNSAEFEYIYDLSKAAESSTVNVNYRQGDIVVAAFYQVRVLEKPTLYSEKLSAKSGDEITVPIFISGNTGLMGLGIELSYDASVMVPESFTASLTGTVGWNKDFCEAGKVKILWSNTEEYVDDGMLFAVNFRILPDAAAGESTIILSYLEEDSFNESYESVRFVCTPATVQVEQVKMPTFYSEPLSAVAGSYLDVPVYYRNNVGVADLSIFELGYDADSFEYMQQIGESDAILKIIQQDGKLRILLNAVSEETEVGVLFTLRFRVKTHAEGSYRFAYTMDDSRWTCQDASAQITAVVLQPTIVETQKTGVVGESISVDVMLEENPGLMGYHLRLPYDPSILSIIDVTPGAAWSGKFDYSVGDGVLDVLWTNSEDVEVNGLLFTLQLSAKEAGEYCLNWECVQENTYNEEWEAVVIDCEAMIVKAEAFKPNPDLAPQIAITVGAEMQVSYTIMIMQVASFQSFYLVVSKNVADGDPVVTTYGMEDGMIAFEEVKNPITGTVLCYRATFEGITAKEMGDEFTTTLYAVTDDGVINCGNSHTDSIKSYLMGVINDARSSSELKTLAVDMLNYGSAAQINFSYDTSNLVNADLTEAQKLLGTKETPKSSDYSSVAGTGAVISTDVSLQSKVVLGLSCIAVGLADPSGVKCVITDAEGKTLAELATENKAGVMYMAKYDNVGAKEMRNLITATFCDADGNAISQTVRWSVESYVASTLAKSSTTQVLANMVNAMLIYGDSTAAYMTSLGR